MVSLTNLHNLEEYRLGFTAAILHDIFNWCTIILLLPLEMGTGALEKVTGYIAAVLDPDTSDNGVDPLHSFSKLFSSIADSLVILKSHAEISEQNIKRLMYENNSSESFESEESLESLEINETSFSSEESSENVEDFLLGEDQQTENITQSVLSIIKEDCGDVRCDFLLADSGLSDEEIGKRLLFNAWII